MLAQAPIPTLDTTSVVTVLVSVVTLAIVIIVVLWRLISQLAADKDALNAARLQDSRDSETKIIALLRDNFEIQETTVTALQDSTHQAEKMQLTIDNLRTSVEKFRME